MTREDVTKNMAKTIEAVIRISEEDFKIMKHNVAIGKPLCSLSEPEMVSKVANGIPLPKGHGRLIDISEYENNYSNIAITFDDANHIYKTYASFIPTIIPADTESEE